MLPIDRPAFFTAQRRIFIARGRSPFVSGRDSDGALSAPMQAAMPPALQPAEWRTSAANSQFVYIALIFSSQGLWYTIDTVKMTATSSLYMIPPHTKIKP